MNLCKYLNKFENLLKKTRCFNLHLESPQINDLLSQFFNQLNDIQHHLQNSHWTKINVQITEVNIKHLWPKTDLKDGFPEGFKSIIKEKMKFQLTYQTILYGKTINIYFFSEKKDSIKNLFNQISLMLMWLSYIISVSKSDSNCCKILTIYFYKLDHNKKIPNNPTDRLHDHHVNSAFTYCCVPNNEIIIFREEEWFKVFIHETFHSFGLDFARQENNKINESLKEVFGLNITYNLTESYCESWARIINIIFCAYWTKNHHKNFDQFQKEFYKLMKLEVFFSVLQMVKVLEFHHLEYDKIISLSRSLTNKSVSNKSVTNNSVTNKSLSTDMQNYKESTPVFSYYVLTCVNLMNLNSFITWCSRNNTIIFNFDTHATNLDTYVQFIKKLCTNKYLLKNISCIQTLFKHNDDDWLNNTLRMSINQISFI